MSGELMEHLDCLKKTLHKKLKKDNLVADVMIGSDHTLIVDLKAGHKYQVPKKWGGIKVTCWKRNRSMTTRSTTAWAVVDPLGDIYWWLLEGGKLEAIDAFMLKYGTCIHPLDPKSRPERWRDYYKRGYRCEKITLTGGKP